MSRKQLTGLLTVSVLVITAVLLVASASRAQAGKHQTFGNHNLHGTYEFHADGVVEVGGVPTRGMWEVGRFEADGKGNMTNGVEYSTLVSSSAEAIIDIPFTFEGTYEINSDGTAKSVVEVFIPATGQTITKMLWFVVYDIDNQGIAHGFAGGHADADLGSGVHGNARTHIGNLMVGPDRGN